LVRVDEATARAAVHKLRSRGAFAHAHPVGVYRYSIRIVIPDGREAIWDADGAAGLEAVIMRNGVLVGMVEHLPDSDDLTVDEIVEHILAADYDKPVATRPRPPGGTPAPPAAAPAPAPSKPRRRSMFRWLTGGD
jgi:hypothetical protein